MKNPTELLLKIKDRLTSEDGQDLVEYSMVIIMIAVGTTAAMQGVASAIASVFQTISTEIVTHV
ncbi:MAG TPA: hypothetical protein VKR52_16920 [Terracidiphilus sp.]|nr:hypothetical protein [Terracidiphilus sp.]